MKDDVLPSQADTLSIRAKADLCVKCGLCLPVCPTYQLTRKESESPRGRIALADSLQAGECIPASTREHLASCLACGACESVCPSKVPFLDLLSETRQLIAAPQHESLRRRTARFLLERPALTRWFKPLLDWTEPQWRSLRRDAVVDQGHSNDPVSAHEGNSIMLLSGCSGDLLEQSVLSALERLLHRCQYPVQRAPAICCGALAKHSGATERATQLMERLQQSLQEKGADICTGVVTGCAEHLVKGLSPTLRYQDPMTLIWARQSHLRFRAATHSVALHLPCSQRRDAQSVVATQALLQLIPGLRVEPLADRGNCCGAAGSYFLDFPDTARSLSARSLVGIDALRTEHLLSANVGCRLQLAQSSGMSTSHPLEFLAAHLETET